MKPYFLIILFFLTSCASIDSRLALREEEKTEFEECYQELQLYEECREESYSNMNKKNKFLIIIKEKYSSDF